MKQKIINKYFFYLFIFTLVFAIILYQLIGFQYIDELCVAVLFMLFFVGVLNTSKWEFNKVFLFTLFIFFFYTCYSIWIGSNTKRGIFNDLIIQLKPYLGFFCAYQLKPSFDDSQKKLIKDIVLVFWFAFLLPIGIASIINQRAFAIVEHPAYFGIIITIVSLCYLFCTPFTLKNRIAFILLLALGILCTRSKFYGFFAMSAFIVLIFPNIHKFKFNFKNILIISSMIVAMLFVAWEKISLYFYDALSGKAGVDEDMIARYVLYRTTPEILIDYFPFGSGFASYATHSSGEYYSKIYAEYGIDTVWGISKEYHDFISDTYYPSLAQFGVVGVLLYTFFWIFIVHKSISLFKKSQQDKPQYLIIILLIVGFLAIEGTTGSTFIAQGGFFVMMMLGLTLSAMQNEIKVNKH